MQVYLFGTDTIHSASHKAEKRHLKHTEEENTFK